jgi:diacylglycerol kinase family enzyme
MVIAPDAKIDDGSLDLVVVEERSRLATLWGMRRLLAGSVERAAQWSTRAVQAVTIEADQPMGFHVDGEPVQGGNVLEATIHPKAVLVAA